MKYDYTIKYRSENHYETPVFEAYWQFLVTPENNSTQKLITEKFTTSVNARIEESVNGLGFTTSRIHCKKPFKDIVFEAEFKLTKREVNPFDFTLPLDNSLDYELLSSLPFRVEFEAYLKNTALTILPKISEDLFKFEQSKSVFENCIALNTFIHNFITFKTGVTNTNTTLPTILENKEGVCQDYTHLMCAVARVNQVPARYVSGYLHQGDGFLGDMQMHAWTELYIPEIGWVGFDSTNNLVANHNHIKVAHGKDYNDCPPLKGIVYSSGNNFTKYTVEVNHQQ
ncbi:transglutaminase-like domain-containing protein [Neptunitalea lumnitzerae]|uniref:Transglutaminase n=1 Tax=Neptunitalea lumnitzerae TaxID=2965509 RepID=A0ABQ5MJP6_9FLAO|nr:transglutaminase family protein [Neptunitalea sp. Y10]GLB49152.1 transglutaminase [Neptunitalea sp. Y10]